MYQRGFYGRGGSSGLSDQVGVRFNYDRQIKGGSISATYTYSYNDRTLQQLTNEVINSTGNSSVAYDTTLTNSQNHRLNLYY